MNSPATFIDPTSAMLRQRDATAPEASAAHPSRTDEAVQVALLRSRVFQAFHIGGWIVSAFAGVLAWMFDPQIWLAAACSALINLFSAGAANGPRRLRRADQWQRAAMTFQAGFQPLIFLVAARLTGFDQLTPLASFVTIMALVAYCDRAVVLAGAAVTFAWMLGHSIIAPGWLFIGEDIWRSVLYAIELAAVTGFAALIADGFERLVRALDRSQRDSAKRADLLHRQAGDLEQALVRIELEQERREEAEARQETKRKEQIDSIARHFEETISVVAASISDTARALERTIKALRLLAHDIGEGAGNAATSSETANVAARNVAQGIAELSTSIATIAATVRQHNDLTETAASRSVSGGEALGSLAREADKVGEATRAIVRIAERTDLLSLNAAIEASSAGPAGRGFTIVAQEVKALAHQAGEAATEIDAFMKRIHSGTHEAQRYFEAIDASISELAQAASAIRWDVERQRKSTDTIDGYAHAAASDVGTMAQRSRELVTTASTAEKLAEELSGASSTMLENVTRLEALSAQFVAYLRDGQ